VDYGSSGADRLVCYEVWDWCELIRKLMALEELDLDYVVVRNREGEQEHIGWSLRVSSGTQQTISGADVVYRPKGTG
jgi:hypothetical protein